MNVPFTPQVAPFECCAAGSHNLSRAAWGVREGGAEFSSARYRLIAFIAVITKRIDPVEPSEPILISDLIASHYHSWDTAGHGPKLSMG